MSCLYACAGMGTLVCVLYVRHEGIHIINVMCIHMSVSIQNFSLVASDIRAVCATYLGISLLETHITNNMRGKLR